LGLGFKNSLMAIGALSALTVAISPFITISFFKGILSKDKVYVVTPKGNVKVSVESKVRRIKIVIAIFGLMYFTASVLYFLHFYIITGLWLLYYSSGYLYTLFRIQ